MEKSFGVLTWQTKVLAPIHIGGIFWKTDSPRGESRNASKRRKNPNTDSEWEWKKGLKSLHGKKRGQGPILTADGKRFEVPTWQTKIPVTIHFLEEPSWKQTFWRIFGGLFWFSSSHTRNTIMACKCYSTVVASPDWSKIYVSLKGRYAYLLSSSLMAMAARRNLGILPPFSSICWPSA